MQRQSAIKGKKGSVAVLDIGNSKVACFIAEPGTDGRLHITGIGHQLARGKRSGVITDVSELETSILSAVHAAEQMSGQTVESVMVSFSGTQISSRLVGVELKLPGDSVTERDIADVIREGCNSVKDRLSSVIHCFATHYQLDGARGIRDPRNMFGSKLGAELHIITADNTALKNLSNCVGRCHLNVSEFIASPHVAGLGCLEPDEMDLGVLLIDIGGGETSFSVFRGGANIFSDAVPIGGNHVTSDIAKGLSTSLADAERLKNLHGSAIAAPQDNLSMLDLHLLGEDEESGEGNTIPRAMLIGIIRPRVEEIFEMIRERLDSADMNGQISRNAVLTGGGSQLMGVRELASRILGKQVRIGKPKLIPGLADSVSGPAFSALVGMLHYAANRPMEDMLFDKRSRTSGLATRSEKIINWFKDNF